MTAAAEYYDDIITIHYFSYYIIGRMMNNIILRARVLSIRIIIARSCHCHRILTYYYYR